MTAEPGSRWTSGVPGEAPFKVDRCDPTYTYAFVTREGTEEKETIPLVLFNVHYHRIIGNLCEGLSI